MISQYHKFVKWSIVGNICSAGSLIAVTIYNIFRLSKIEISPVYWELKEFSSFFGVCIFSFEVICHIFHKQTNILNIYYLLNNNDELI